MSFNSYPVLQKYFHSYFYPFANGCYMNIFICKRIACVLTEADFSFNRVWSAICLNQGKYKYEKDNNVTRNHICFCG